MKEVQAHDMVIGEHILQKARELASLIAQSEEAIVFREAERVIAQHDEVQGIIALIKKRQKEAVAFEHTFQNKQMVEKIEREIAELEEKLQSYPIVNQFQQMQVDLNQTLQSIVRVLYDTLSQTIAIEQGAKSHE